MRSPIGVSQASLKVIEDFPLSGAYRGGSEWSGQRGQASWSFGHSQPKQRLEEHFLAAGQWGPVEDRGKKDNVFSRKKNMNQESSCVQMYDSSWFVYTFHGHSLDQIVAFIHPAYASSWFPTAPLRTNWSADSCEFVTAQHVQSSCTIPQLQPPPICLFNSIHGYSFI